MHCNPHRFQALHEVSRQLPHHAQGNRTGTLEGHVVLSSLLQSYLQSQQVDGRYDVAVPHFTRFFVISDERDAVLEHAAS
jgi:hypothetical protein